MDHFPFCRSLFSTKNSTIFVGVWIAFLSLGLNPFFAFSEEEPSQTQEEPAPEGEDIPTMEPVVISATKTPVPISHLTSSVEVITAETIKNRKIKTVPEALRLSQGLVILQSGGPGGTATARIRGASADKP